MKKALSQMFGSMSSRWGIEWAETLSPIGTKPLFKSRPYKGLQLGTFRDFTTL